MDLGVGHLLVEYGARKKLAELGFTSSLSDLPAEKGQAFVLISAQISELIEKERKRKTKKGK